MSNKEDPKLKVNPETDREKRQKILDDAADQFVDLFLQQALRMRAEKAEREKNNKAT